MKIFFSKLSRLSFLKGLGCVRPWPALALLAVAVNVWGQSPGDFCYTVNPDNARTVTITGYTGAGGIVTIPSAIAGKTVSGIGSCAFYDHAEVTSVTVPASVIEIGDAAFAMCGGLTNVTITKGVANIGSCAFYSCPELASVIIPASVTNIGGSAFGDCANLSTVSMTKGLVSIAERVFEYCGSLKSVALPSSVTSIGGIPFYCCSELDAIHVDAANPVFCSLEGVLFNKSMTKLILYPTGRAGGYSVPNGVTSIGDEAFLNCSGVVSVTIPDSVNEIGIASFAECYGLKTVFFKGDAPCCGDAALHNSDNAICYYLAGRAGWGPLYSERQTVLWEKGAHLLPLDYSGEVSSEGAFDGCFYSTVDYNGAAGTAVRGIFALKLTGAAGKLSAKAVVQRGSLSFSAGTWTGVEPDGTRHATVTARSGETLELYVQQNRIWGSLEGGSLGSETYMLDGARNQCADRKGAAAQARLNGFGGYYTVALPAYDARLQGAADAAPEGVGYLTLTVGNTGNVKIAGRLADGTKVSQSSRLILFDGFNARACLPVFVPLYARSGWAGGLLWIDRASRTVATERDDGWFICWEKPSTGPDGFVELLDVCGGVYSVPPALAARYNFSALLAEIPYYFKGGVADAQWAFPELSVAVNGLWMSIPRGVRPVLVDGEYDYFSSENSAMATLSFSAWSGIFKGKFNLYYDYMQNGKLQHKAVSVPYAGVLTPVRAAAFTGLPAGQGAYLAPDNNPAFLNDRLKRSCPVWLEAAP